MKNIIIVFLSEFIVLYLIALIVSYLFSLNRKIKINDRFSRYTIYKAKKETKIFDQIFSSFDSLIKLVSKILYRIKLFNTYSIKYQKHIKREEKETVDKMDFVSKKVLCGFLYVGIVLLYDLFKYQSVTIIQILIAFLAGFYTIDIFLVSTNKLLHREKENDLLRAITIMNNSFKSGHSIMQSIKLVSDELDSPLGQEFKKMYVDLTYGLSLDVVFQRFESRVKMEEVKYITTSLIILNETGGDIVKVFESVERTFFNEKKLDDELKNLTASSKMLYYILLFIPIVFILIIYVLDNTYFNPFFQTGLIGYSIVVFCILLYSIYYFLIRRIIKIGGKL